MLAVDRELRFVGVRRREVLPRGDRGEFGRIVLDSRERLKGPLEFVAAGDRVLIRVAVEEPVLAVVVKEQVLQCGSVYVVAGGGAVQPERAIARSNKTPAKRLMVGRPAFRRLLYQGDPCSRPGRDPRGVPSRRTNPEG